MGSGTKISPSELSIQVWQNCLSELLSIFPQLDAAFAALTYAPCQNLEKISTDGSAIRFPPAGILRLYRDVPAALRRGYLHMLLHCLYFHPFQRRGGGMWDLAADMAVELVIEKAAVPRLALEQDPVRERCFQLLHGKDFSAEELFDMLNQNYFPFPPEEMERAFCFDSHEIWSKEPEKCAQNIRKWGGLASGAGRGGAGAGRSAGNSSENVAVTKRSAYDYRKFLRQFTSQREEVLLDPENFDLVLYSFGMEQFGNLPLVEPLEYQEVSRLEELVIAIDTSGSCSAETVRRFLEETYAIVSNQENFFRKMNVFLIQCDCLVQKVTVLHSPEDWEDCFRHITIQGRGGTDFTPVFRYVEELRQKKILRNLKALLYFTDGDGVYPRTPPVYQTAFVFLHKSDKMEHVPPWAVRLVLENF